MPRVLVFRVAVLFLAGVVASTVGNNAQAMEFIAMTTLGRILISVYFGLALYWLLFKVAPVAFAYLDRKKK